MLEKLNLGSRSEFLKVWSPLITCIMQGRDFQIVVWDLGHKINSVLDKHFLEKKKKKEGNGMERNGIESLLHVVRVMVFYLSVHVYVLSRDINLLPTLSPSQIRNMDLGAC